MTKIGDIGTSKLIDWDVEASFYVSVALIKKSNLCCSSFINQSIKANYFQSELHKRIIHVAFPRKINLGEIGECWFWFPSITEQTKIANFLSAIDDKIENLLVFLSHWNLFKQSLLQKMFV